MNVRSKKTVAPSCRLTNLFGALAIGVADRVRGSALAQTEMGGETLAALVVIGHAPLLSIDRLGKILKLSHAGTVRLVDRLVSAGFATRSAASHDRRVIALKLTDLGQAKRKAILDRRHVVLAGILGGLSPDEQAAVEKASYIILRSLAQDATSALNICRFCNEQQCDDCPMEIFGALD